MGLGAPATHGAQGLGRRPPPVASKAATRQRRPSRSLGVPNARLRNPHLRDGASLGATAAVRKALATAAALPSASHCCRAPTAACVCRPPGPGSFPRLGRRPACGLHTGGAPTRGSPCRGRGREDTPAQPLGAAMGGPGAGRGHRWCAGQSIRRCRLMAHGGCVAWRQDCCAAGPPAHAASRRARGPMRAVATWRCLGGLTPPHSLPWTC